MASTLGLAILETAVDLDGLNSGLGSAEQVAGRAGGGISGALGGALGGLATVGVAAGTAVVAGVGAVGAAALSVGNQVNQAANSMQATLGVSADEAQRLADVAANVFGNNFAGSIAEAATVTAEARQQLGALSDNELQRATENAFRLSDTFGINYAESLNSVRALTENFGLTSDQAFDLITTGMQSGLNSSGDFLDSIGEYSNQFADAGFSADQMYSIMATGSEAGVLGTDKISDAVKEMGIRLNEGGADVDQAFATIGLSFDDIAAEVASGRATWGDYFGDITGGLAGIEDPMVRAQAQTAIFGTAAEDLGVSFTTGLSDATAAVDDMAGATDGLDVKYNNLRSVMEEFGRQALLALEPLGSALLELVNAVMPAVERAFGWFTSNVVPVLEQAFEVFGDVIGSFVDGLERGEKPIDAFTGALEGLIPDPVLDAIRTLADIIETVFGAVLDNARLAVAGFSAALDGDFGALFTNLGQMFQNGIATLVDVFNSLATLIGPALASAGAAIVAWVSSQDWRAIGLQVADLIVTGLMQLIELASNLLGQAADVFAGWVNSIDWPAVGKTVVVAILTGLKWLITDLPPLLAEWATAFWNWITTYDWAALADSIVNGLVAGLQNAGSAVLNALVGIAEGAVSGFKEFFGIASPSKLFAELGGYLIDGLAFGISDNADAAGGALDAAAAMLALNGAEAFGNALQAVAESVAPAIEALNQIGAFEAPAQLRHAIEQLRQAAEYLVEAFAATAWLLSERSNGGAVGLARDMSSALDAVAGSVVEAIEAFDRIAAFTLPAGLDGMIAALVAAVDQLVGALSGVAATFEAEALQHAAAFAAAAGDLVDLVEPAIDAIMSIPEYVRAVGFGDAVAVFANDLTVVIETLANAFERYLTPIRQAVTNAGELADAAGSLIDILAPAFEVMASFGDYVRAADLAGQVYMFANDLTVVIETLANAFERYLTPIRQAVTNAGDMADSVNQIVGVVEPGFEVLAAFSQYIRAAALDGAVAGFARDLVTVAETLASAFSEAFKRIGAKSIRQAAKFAEAVASIARSTADALAAVDDMASATLPDILPALGYILTNSSLIAATLASAVATVNGRIVDAAVAFAANVATVVAEVLASLASLADLAAGNVPGSLQAILNAMVAALNNAIPRVAAVSGLLAASIRQAFEAPPWESIGYAIGQGIAAGLTRSAGLIANAARRAAETAYNSAANALGIASPSRLFAELGDQVNAGFAAGLARTGDQPAAAVADTVAGMVAAANVTTTTSTNYYQFSTPIPAGLTAQQQIDAMIEAALLRRGIRADQLARAR